MHTAFGLTYRLVLSPGCEAATEFGNACSISVYCSNEGASSSLSDEDRYVVTRKSLGYIFSIPRVINTAVGNPNIFTQDLFP
jgi:hypothetical protein